MKKIIIAGAGHGGLTAAGHLARAGFQVEVYERHNPEKMGYDWTDIFDLRSFEYAGIPLPPKSEYTRKEDMTFLNPSKTVRLTPHIPDEFSEMKMERKDIYRHLIHFAESGGAKIFYESRVEAPLFRDGKLCGIRLEGNREIIGDLVIDACGLDSPVRKNLPESYEILKDFGKTQIFYAYRAFYEKIEGTPASDKYKIYFFHRGKKGISWVATEENYVDILIGRFEQIDETEIRESLADLKKDNPQLGSALLRGGSAVPISVRKPLPVFVGDYYAAVGDSAGMTIPIIGSGIANSIIAGKILADTIIKHASYPLTAEALWEYQTTYMKEKGARYAGADGVKEFLISIHAKDIDFLFEHGIITKNDLMSASAGRKMKLPLPEMLLRAKRGIRNPRLLLKLVKALSASEKTEEAAKAIPAVYDKKAIEKWRKKYIGKLS